MKKFILCFLFGNIVFTASSQKVYFVYLQAETAQPFFVKMNEKLYNSTTAGYLILSNLRDTIYSLSIGFPQNKIPEQLFSITIDKKDHGYLIKNFPQKRWGLYDLQTSSVQMSTTPVLEASIKKEEQNSSVFTDVLSKAANDPSLKEKTVQSIVAEKKPEIVLQEAVNKANEKPVIIEQQDAKQEDSPVQINEKLEIKKEEIKDISLDTYNRSVVIRKSESSNVEGFGLVFIDQYENSLKDTIRILIPNPKPISVEIKEDAKEEKKFLNIVSDTSDKNNKIAPESIKSATPPLNQTAIRDNIGNKCVEIASENDFSLLTKRIAIEKTDSGKISQALKNLSLKCYTTDQIRKLGTLFLKDESRYKFFNAAYPFVFDSSNFVLLRSEFKDVFYVNKFREMLH